jgi:hypothetical protein
MAQGWLPPPTNSWDVTDLSQQTGGPLAPGSGGVHAFAVLSQGDGVEGVTRCVTYFSVNAEGPSEIHQLKFQFDSGWKDSNLSAGLAALIPNQRPVAYLFRAPGTVHVIYLGHASPSSLDPQIQELWAYQDCWHANDQNCWQANNLTVATGAPSPTSAPPVAYAVGQDNQLHGIRWQAGNWSRHDPILRSQKGRIPGATTASPVGYISDGVERVSYVGLDRHVHELSFPGDLGDRWDLQDPSLETNTSVDPDAQLAAYPGLEPGTRRIIVIPGVGGSVQQLSNAGGHWNFSVLIDSNGPGGDKAPDASARPGAFAVPAARLEFVYYPSISFHVVELAGPQVQIIERGIGEIRTAGR